jgi:hypothetical protein
VTENNYGSGINRVRRLGTGPADSPILVEGTSGNWISNLEFARNGGPAMFRAYQPVNGGRLRYTSTDYWSLFERRELTPLRPSTSLSGPGTVGVGSITMTVADAPPAGLGIVAYGPSALYDPLELPLMLPGASVPSFLGLDLGTMVIGSQVYPVSPLGEMTAFFANTTGNTGVVATQVLLFDDSLQIVGISSAAFL